MVMAVGGLIGRAGRAAMLAGGLVLAGAAGVPVGGQVAAEPAPAAAVDLQAEAAAAVDTWISALVGGDPDRVAPVLAPEFQIQREDGSAYDRDGYLGLGLPNFPEKPEIGDLVATGHGDIMVVRYTLTLPADATIEGHAVQRTAHRLTVFRRDGDAWLVSAHANFATPEN